MSPVASSKDFLEYIVFAALLHGLETVLWLLEEHTSDGSWNDVASRWWAADRAERASGRKSWRRWEAALGIDRAKMMHLMLNEKMLRLVVLGPW